MSSEERVDERNFGDPTKISADEAFRSIVGQYWENDNDEGEVEIKLEGSDGTISQVTFSIKITAIDGVDIPSKEEEHD